MIGLTFEAFRVFWGKHPALLYSLSILLGAYLGFNGFSWSLLIPMFFLIASLAGQMSRLFLVCLLSVGFFIFVQVHYQFPKAFPENGILGTAHLKITSLSSEKTAFGQNWVYKGKIKTFISDVRYPPMHLHNIPYMLSLPLSDEINRPIANSDYQVHGTLKRSSHGAYFFKVAKEEPWLPVSESWSFAEYRFQAKKAVTDYIHQHISNPRSAAFLSGIATGEFNDRLMVFEFARFGLLHIMAISGFHFAIVAAILGLILRLFLHRRTAYLLLMFLLTSYFVFLGCSPSIMRAWITIMIALVGFLAGKRGFALNSMGVALTVTLLIDPLFCQQMGFQFSFLTTAAILCFFSSFEEFSQKLFLKRSLSSVIEMTSYDQHAYLTLASFRQALALALAVNLVALPVSLYYFHKFPLLSLLYNLFFPFMVSIGMILLILGVAFSLIPFVGNLIHALNSVYTEFMLNFTYNLPTTWDMTWRISNLPSEVFITYLCVVFFVGIIVRHRVLKKKEALQDIAFI